jgi:hypothetical protein
VAATQPEPLPISGDSGTRRGWRSSGTMASARTAFAASHCGETDALADQPEVIYSAALVHARGGGCSAHISSPPRAESRKQHLASCGTRTPWLSRLLP